MEKLTFEKGMRGFSATAFLLAAAMLALACTLLIPSNALAADYVAHSIDKATGARTDYASIDDALSAGCSDTHPTIVMDTDWTIANLEVPAGKKLTIDMHGYTIERTKTNFDVRKGAELTLMSSEKKEITYKGYEPSNGKLVDVTKTTGGLLTCDSSSRSTQMCTIFLDASSTVNLIGVTVAGNPGYSQGGGFQMADASVLNMSDGASIEHNLGSGIYARGNNVRINLDNASISSNLISSYGGGIHADNENAYIALNNGAKIDGNYAAAGGGIFFSRSGFTLTSDGTGVVSNNVSTKSDRSATKYEQSGGGIHVDQNPFEGNSGLIENVTISNNYSAYDGGGIELDQEWTTVKNCTITGNTCKYEGGGIYVCNDDNTIDGCTITNNACDLDGSSYEGGGVFVWCDYDIKLTGLCYIYDNTRGKNSGNADDLFLRENWLATAKAYVTGGVKAGSRVGIRNGITGDRMIGKNINNDSKDSFFIDLTGYYVSYGSDHGGDMWQRHVGMQYAVQVNGKDVDRYDYGSTVTVDATSTDSSKVFMYWDTTNTSGLYPVSAYITKDNKYNAKLTFTMPQCDVKLTAVYADRVKKAELVTKAPVAGKDLPTTAILKRADKGQGASGSNKVPVTWYKIKADGTRIAVSGKAKTNTTYVAVFSAAQSVDKGLFFDKTITNSGNLKLDFTGSSVTGADISKNALLDAATGTLTAESSKFTTSTNKAANKDALKAVKNKTKTVKADKKAGKTTAAASFDIKAAASASGAKASFKFASGSKKVKVTKAGKITLKKGAVKGKTYEAKIKVSYGKQSKTITVKFKVK